MQSIPLKDIADFIRTGKTPPTKDIKYFNGEIQWFTPGDLNKDKYLEKSARTLTDEAFKDKKAARFPANTLLVACIGDIGKLGITTQESSSNQQITGIKPKGNVDVSYLFYWFRHNKTFIQNTANNAVVPILNNKTLEQIKIPLPLLVEQQKIAAILDAADSLRQKDQQLVERYTALSQSLFLDMFGDPVTNPMGWKTYTWNDILDIKNGKNQKAVEDLNGKYPIYGSGGNVMAYANQFICNENTVIIGRKGNINKPILIKEKFWNVDTAFGLQAKPERLSYLYLYWFCVFFNFETLNKTVTIPSLTKSDLLRIETPLPPIELQNQFAERIQLIEAQKQQAQCSLEKSEALFNSLLQRAFTGELTAKMAA